MTALTLLPTFETMDVYLLLQRKLNVYCVQNSSDLYHLFKRKQIKYVLCANLPLFCTYATQQNSQLCIAHFDILNSYFYHYYLYCNDMEISKHLSYVTIELANHHYLITSLFFMDNSICIFFLQSQ